MRFTKYHIHHRHVIHVLISCRVYSASGASLLVKYHEVRQLNGQGGDRRVSDGWTTSWGGYHDERRKLWNARIVAGSGIVSSEKKMEEHVDIA